MLYTHDIQSELIEIITKLVLKQIHDKVVKTGYYSKKIRKNYILESITNNDVIGYFASLKPRKISLVWKLPNCDK